MASRETPGRCSHGTGRLRYLSSLNRLVSALRAADRATLFAIAAGALLVAAVLRASWTCDDAFISLRTVDNFVNGFGLRWNVSERVQSYTHPLWLIAVALFYLPGRSPDVALLLPSLVATTGFIAWFVARARDRWLAGALLLLLLSSKAFVEFSTSGLENPLLHLLLLGFLLAVTRTLETSTGLGRVFAFTAGLLVTRMDVLVLIAPALVLAAWRARADLRRTRTWLGLAPLVVWHIFSLLYYGFLFPNTAYAKLATAVPLAEATAMGWQVLVANLEHDPFTLCTIALAIAIGLARRRPLGMLLALALFAWLVYWVVIGGDFMLGRVLTPPLCVAVVILLDGLPAALRRPAPIGAVALVVVAALLPRTALLGPPRRAERGWLPEHVTDERAIFHAMTGLFGRASEEDPRSHRWVRDAMKSVAGGERVIAARSVGFVGYYLGPQIHIVDEFALCDPLLARLPATPSWSPGHFERTVPAGYLDTLRTGQNRLRDPAMARAYDELSRILRDPIFSATRLETVLRWTVDPPSMIPPDYQVRHVAETILAGAPGDGAPVGDAGVLRTDRQGLSVDLAGPAAVVGLQAALEGDDHYRIALRRRGEIVWSTSVTPEDPRPGRLRMVDLSLPERLSIDSVLIQGRRGDYKYHVGLVRLVRAP
jgi:arabinofuranosyltransferase